MPADSVFFDKIVPAALLILAIVTAILILLALAFLLGITPS
jgi:hypothetical protein